MATMNKTLYTITLHLNDGATVMTVSDTATKTSGSAVKSSYESDRIMHFVNDDGVEVMMMPYDVLYMEITSTVVSTEYEDNVCTTDTRCI